METTGNNTEVVEILDDDEIEVLPNPNLSSVQNPLSYNQYPYYYSNTSTAYTPPYSRTLQGPMSSLMSYHYNGPQTLRQPSNTTNSYASYMNTSQSNFEDNWDLSNISVPEYVDYKLYNHVPKWDNILPQNLNRKFDLNLISLTYFQITEEILSYNPFSRLPLAGLRKMIKQLSKGHGTPLYDAAYFGMDKGMRAAWMDRPARWRIPLGCYHQFHTWLVATGGQVKGIPLEKLNSASVSKAKAEQKAPSPEELIKLGIPYELVHSLAPYQRTGVKFIHDKGGRALIADEMGLGKTVQSISASFIYHKEWPVLVVCPAGAKFHWESEYLYWLGQNSNLYQNPNTSKRLRRDYNLLTKTDIKVFSSVSDTFNISSYKVVIVSYSVATRLIEDRIIRPHMFQIILADESHNLKNYNTKRTKMLLPILRITKRCILISGTPSLAKPKELLPQLEMLRPSFKEQFKERYCKNTNNFELHMFLTSECMIRRLKNDILKDLPPKQRELIYVSINDQEFQDDWKDLYQKYKEFKRTGHSQQQNAFMFKLYQRTGIAKVPIIVKELQNFLADPTLGKICIFAHHVAVLDKIANSINSSTLIRIDGSVNPQNRTERITSFQNDPTIRVALLGICAASVCVSLTASSTVWFAELFWTPSIMLQAEDRCHRIGQRATVKVKYFNAKDTMDDTIWQMIKKKYENLGEYVDGITTTFDIDGDHDLPMVKKEFLAEAKEFQAEEIAELQYEDESTDESDECAKPSAIKDDDVEVVDASGISSSAAIYLSDEEDKDDDNSIDSIEEYPDMKIYKMSFPGPTYGLVLVPHRGRVIVHQRTSKRITDLGRDIKPHVGDILVSVDNLIIYTSTPFVDVLNLMKKKLMSNTATELIFAEDKGFAEYYKKDIRFKFANHQHSCDDDALPNQEKMESSGTNALVPTVINLADEE